MVVVVVVVVGSDDGGGGGRISVDDIKTGQYVEIINAMVSSG